MTYRKRQDQRTIDDLRDTLDRIDAMPFSMVNDSDSLRHTIRTMQHMARTALYGGSKDDPSPKKSGPATQSLMSTDRAGTPDA